MADHDFGELLGHYLPSDFPAPLCWKCAQQPYSDDQINGCFAEVRGPASLAAPLRSFGNWITWVCDNTAAVRSASGACPRGPRLSSGRPRLPHLTKPPRGEHAAGPVRLAVVGFLVTAAFSGSQATFSLFAGRRFGLTEASVAAVFVGFGLLLVRVQGLVGRITHRLGVGPTLRLLSCGTRWHVPLRRHHHLTVLVPALRS